MKRILTLLLSLLLVATSFAHLGTALAAEEPTLDTLWAVPWFTDALYEEYANMENDPMLKWLGEKFNMNFTVRSFTGDHSYLMLGFAAGTEPDGMGMLNWAGGDTLFEELVDQDALVNIGELVGANPDRYPVLYKLMQEDYWRILNYKNHGDFDTCYALYNLQAGRNPTGAVAYYMPYLEAAGYTEETLPVTVDEFYDCLTAIKNSDVDGNGVAGDTMPWSPNSYQGTSFDGVEQIFFQTLGLRLGIAPQYEDASEYVNYAIDERTKEGHKLVAKFYQEGLLDQEFITRESYGNWTLMGAGQVASVTSGFPADVDHWQYMSATNVFTEAGLKLDSYKDLMFAREPMAGPEGIISKFWGRPLGSSTKNVISANTTDPLRILDVYEFLYSDAGQNFTFFGIPEVHYTLDDQNNPVFIDEAGYYEICSHYDEATTWNPFSITTNLGRHYGQYERDGWVDGTMKARHIQAEREERSEARLYANSVSQIYLDKCYFVLPDEYDFVTISGDWAEISKNLTTVMWRHFSLWWTGQVDVDAGWDAYVADMKAAKSDELLAEYNRQLTEARELLSQMD